MARTMLSSRTTTAGNSRPLQLWRRRTIRSVRYRT